MSRLAPHCGDLAILFGHALGTLPPEHASAIDGHVAWCPECSAELRALGPVLEPLAAVPDLPRPSSGLRDRLRARIAAPGTSPRPSPPPPPEPEWDDVGPGICCRVLAEDEETGMVSMLVRLAPGAEYPAHTHSGLEELHLLGGELWIDDRKLFAGDYNRAPAGTSDRHVWSETGCTCVLVTSRDDRLGLPDAPTTARPV